MIYDLHCHSNCSDGELSPDHLLSCASDNSVDVLSVTDHDSVQAYKSLSSQESRSNKVILVPGVEFSTCWQATQKNQLGIHVVGLNINPDHDAIQYGVKQQQTARRKRAEKIAERLEKAGLKQALAGAEKYAGSAPIARPHFASFMVETGFSRSIEHAFKKYLGSGKVGDVRDGWADLQSVITWINESGGIAVLAHPHKYKLTRTRLVSLIESFQAAGGRAIEVLCGPQDKNTTDALVTLATEKKLLASMGSDFHHQANRWSHLGMHTALPAKCAPVWEAF